MAWAWVEKKIKSKRAKTAKGKKTGTVLTYEDDTKKTLLNPYGKGAKYAQELKTGQKYTNDNQIKTVNGEIKPLTDTEKAYRSGYLAARRDAADAYNAKNNPEKLAENKAKRKAARIAARTQNNK